MKILHITLTEGNYKATYAYWSGNGLGTIPSGEPVLADVEIYQSPKVYVYQSPWYIKTRKHACEAIMLTNDEFNDIRITVNGSIYVVAGKSTIVVPVTTVLSEAFIDLCHEHAIYDIKDASKAYIVLSKLTWQTGVNAFMEAIQ